MVNRIKLLCENRKISIKQLERDLGFGNGTIRRWDENMPSIARIASVADYFDVSISWLMGESGTSDLLLLTALDNGLLTDGQLHQIANMGDDSKYRREAERETGITIDSPITDKGKELEGRDPKAMDNKKSPTPEGAELDPVTRELFEIVNGSNEDELNALLEMARLIKKRRDL